MCIKYFKNLRMVQPLMSPAPSELAPLPEVHLQGHLYGLAYMGGYKQFPQNNGYLPFANQTTTTETIGLLSGQMFGQPLVPGN